MSWDDTQNYIKWLNKKTGHIYGLPTEAQWEYAAQAGSSSPFWFGDTITTDQANYDGNYPYNGNYRRKMLPVDSFEANPFGLYQVRGNVREWLNDWYRDYEKESQTDPNGAKSGQKQINRGGNWYAYAKPLRSALRNILGFPGDRVLGFRLVRQLS